MIVAAAEVTAKMMQHDDSFSPMFKALLFESASGCYNKVLPTMHKASSVIAAGHFKYDGGGAASSLHILLGTFYRPQYSKFI